jgi:hypothetical protein
MIEQYVRQLLTAKKERDTDYDGPFSHPGEYHAFAIGAGAGVATATTGQTQLASAVITLALTGDRTRVGMEFVDNIQHEIVREGWYAIFGLAIGYLAGTFL